MNDRTRPTGAFCGAMSADETRPEVRRTRPIKREKLALGPARDLRDHLYELYLSGGAQRLDDLAKWIEDNDLPACPRRDTISRVIGGRALPNTAYDADAIGAALAHFAGRPIEAAQREAKDLWAVAIAASAIAEEPAAPEVG